MLFLCDVETYTYIKALGFEAMLGHKPLVMVPWTVYMEKMGLAIQDPLFMEPTGPNPLYVAPTVHRSHQTHCI